MKLARDGVLIVAVMMLVDFTFTWLLPPAWLDPNERSRLNDQRVADYTVPYNHALKPNLGPLQRQFGILSVPYQTDRFGFRTGACAGTDPAAEANSSVFVIGDSFTEGVGVPFEESFAGLMACEWRKHGLAVWNLGVQAYSPSIYYHRLVDAVRKTSIKPKAVFVFLDISDISDEALIYEEKDGKVVTLRKYYAPIDRQFFGWSAAQIGAFLNRNFMTGKLAVTLHTWWRLRKGPTLNDPKGNWTVNPESMQAYGTKGLAKAAFSLDRIATACKEWGSELTLVVYPWPNQIVHDDEDSIQVRYWRDWARSRDVRFINGFTPFFAEPKQEALAKFIPADFHFNAAGHRLLFDEVSRTVWKERAPQRD